jgi:hypothetical protein
MNGDFVFVRREKIVENFDFFVLIDKSAFALHFRSFGKAFVLKENKMDI